MKDLEKQIREALSERYADNYIRVMTDETVKPALIKAIEKISGPVAELQYTDEIAEEVPFEEFEKMVIEKTKEYMFDDPQYLQREANESGRTMLLTKKQSLKELSKDINLKGKMKKDFMRRINEFLDNYDEDYEFKENLIKELVIIGEKEGLNIAAMRKTQNKVIRKLIPSAEEYITRNIKFRLLGSKVYEITQQILFPDDDDDEEGREILANVFDPSIELMTTLTEYIVKMEAKEIYEL